MPITYTLSWTTAFPALCPSCLEALNDANIVFVENLAFCPLCALPYAAARHYACLRIFRSTLSPNHRATYRRLDFFTPQRHPGIPLQLVRRHGKSSWLLNPDTDDLPPAEDDNPVAGGSPI